MIRIEMDMPKDCANCPMTLPVKDGLRTIYFCKIKMQQIQRVDLFQRQTWCPMHEDEKPAGGTGR